MAKEKVDLLILNANELLTLKGGNDKPLTGKSMRNLAIIKNGSLAAHEGKIVAVGKTKEIKRRFEGEEVIDAEGKIVLPGFVDPHTHLVFAGSRENEFELRIEGASYMEILQRGGGILQTVVETRKTSEEELLRGCMKTLDAMLLHGTTTVEAKSGYGLDRDNEIKCLQVLKRLNEKHPVSVVSTFLGAHAVPPEKSADEYVKFLIEEMIPTVANLKLAEFCDVFCEKGVFNIEQSRRILLSGKEHGLKPKLHADELSWIGGAELAAELEAVSADHLLFASEKGMEALAEKNVVAVLLPLASFTLMMGCYADARRMIDIGVPVALGTDFNPSCWAESQQLTIAFACRQLKLTPAEAITATTVNAAHAINRAHEVGSLEAGKKADVTIFDVPNHKFLGYRFGVNLAETVVKNGRIVVDYGKLVNYRHH